MKKRQIIGLSLALLVLVLTLIVPVPNGLTVVGKNTIGITLFFLILLITEALPLIVSCLLTIGLTPLFKVTEKFSGAVMGFAHPVVFFIIASFGIAGAIMNTSITKRFLLALLKRFGNSIGSILLAMMIATAGASLFMSNVPTCAIMMSIALEFVQLFEEGEDRKSVGKAFMIAVPVATMIGGMSTPASSSLNLLAIGLLEQLTGGTVTFVQWMAIGIPLVLVFLPVAWFLILKIYKPAQIDTEKVKQYMEKIRVSEKINKRELYVITVMIGMLALWIASSWVPAIEIYTVALLGCVLFLVPGIEILPIKKFVAGINWDIIFITGTVLSTANAMVENNVSAWLVERIYPSHLALGPNMLVGLAALVAFIMLLLITSAPALITVLAGPFVTIAAANGCPPALLIIALAFCACNCYLFPLDTVQLLTYSTGYYRMTDMGKSTIFLQILMVLVLAFWLPFMGGIFKIIG